MCVFVVTPINSFLKLSLIKKRKTMKSKLGTCFMKTCRKFMKKLEKVYYILKSLLSLFVVNYLLRMSMSSVLNLSHFRMKSTLEKFMSFLKLFKMDLKIQTQILYTLLNSFHIHTLTHLQTNLYTHVHSHMYKYSNKKQFVFNE